MNNIFNREDLKKFENLIAESTRIVLCCHQHPDGDAIGSTLGLCQVLRSMGKDATVVVPDMPPRNLSFLPGFNEIAVCSRHDPYCARLIGDADLIIGCDFNEIGRIGNLGDMVMNAKAKRVLIDHHLDPKLDCDVTFSFPEMSSTCELVFRLIAACGYYPLLDTKGATCLLTGLITDTQNFTVNSNDPEIYEILGHLMEKGVDKERIIREAVKAVSLDSLRLKAFAVAERMEILRDHRVALIALTHADLEAHNYVRGDTEGLVNTPLDIRGIYASIFLREDSDCIKISARSLGDYPVSELCKKFNGGGHLNAAGAEFYGSLEDCIRMVKEELVNYDSYLPTKLEPIS